MKAIPGEPISFLQSQINIEISDSENIIMWYP